MRRVLGRVAEAVVPAALTVGAVFNVALMFNAPEGVRMNAHLKEEIAKERRAIASLEAQEQDLSARADGLMTASLDRDLLDERVRSVLGLAEPGELMVRIEDLDRLANAASVSSADPFKVASARGLGERRY